MHLADLLDITLVQKLAAANHTANGMPIGIVDARDGSILAGYGWQDICVRFHRVHPRSRERCEESDRFIRKHLSADEPCEYACLNGMRDIGIAIFVAGEHLATLFLGQFFYEGESPDREFFIRQARDLGYDEAAYLVALDQVPVFSRQAVDNTLGYNRALARIIGDLAERELRRRQAEERLREAQERAVRAERLVSLGTLAGGVAHEINNPLACILGNLHFLSGELSGMGADGSGKVEEVRRAAAEAVEGAERVRRIVQDLLAFARPSGRLGPVDLHRVLDLATNVAASEIRPRARIVRDYGPIPPVHGDESRLGQVALNLLVNAAQAIPAGKPQEHQVRVATCMDASGRVRIEISDTGQGIPPEVRARVFEPFFTTKPVGVGTGLGLSICHGIVNAMGGEIALESEVGKGTVVRVWLPLAGAGPSGVPPPLTDR